MENRTLEIVFSSLLLQTLELAEKFDGQKRPYRITFVDSELEVHEIDKPMGDAHEFCKDVIGALKHKPITLRMQLAILKNGDPAKAKTHSCQLGFRQTANEIVEQHYLEMNQLLDKMKGYLDKSNAHSETLSNYLKEEREENRETRDTLHANLTEVRVENRGLSQYVAQLKQQMRKNHLPIPEAKKVEPYPWEKAWKAVSDEPNGEAASAA